MTEGSPKEVRVDVLLRVFAGQLLKARSATGVANALDRVGRAFALSLVCVVPLDEAYESDKRLRFFGRVTTARAQLLNVLVPLRTHPLFSGTARESGTVIGALIRKKSALSPAAWQARLPDMLKGRETLSLIVRHDERGRSRDAWFVLFGARPGKLGGLARSVMLVAAHLAYDRSRAMAHEKCGRVPSAPRANEALRLIASGGSDISLVRPPQRRATRRDGSSDSIH